MTLPVLSKSIGRAGRGLETFYSILPGLAAFCNRAIFYVAWNTTDTYAHLRPSQGAIPAIPTDLPTACACANALAAELALHTADKGNDAHGSDWATHKKAGAVYTQVAAPAVDLTTLEALTAELVTAMTAHLADANAHFGTSTGTAVGAQTHDTLPHCITALTAVRASLVSHYGAGLDVALSGLVPPFMMAKLSTSVAARLAGVTPPVVPNPRLGRAGQKLEFGFEALFAALEKFQIILGQFIAATTTHGASFFGHREQPRMLLPLAAPAAPQNLNDAIARMVAIVNHFATVHIADYDATIGHAAAHKAQDATDVANAAALATAPTDLASALTYARNVHLMIKNHIENSSAHDAVGGGNELVMSFPADLPTLLAFVAALGGEYLDHMSWAHAGACFHVGRTARDGKNPPITAPMSPHFGYGGEGLDQLSAVVQGLHDWQTATMWWVAQMDMNIASMQMTHNGLTPPLDAAYSRAPATLADAIAMLNGYAAALTAHIESYAANAIDGTNRLASLIGYHKVPNGTLNLATLATPCVDLASAKTLYAALAAAINEHTTDPDGMHWGILGGAGLVATNVPTSSADLPTLLTNCATLAAAIDAHFAAAEGPQYAFSLL